MKLSEAKPLVIAAWEEWAAKRALRLEDATGPDALRFYFELEDTKSPLLNFNSRAPDKFLVVHDWLMSERWVES